MLQRAAACLSAAHFVLRARPCALPCLRARDGALTRGLRLQGADVWAFSVLLFELITGKAAFAGMNHAQARRRLGAACPAPATCGRVLGPGCRWPALVA